MRAEIDEGDTNSIKKKISSYKVESLASSSTNVRYKKTSSLP